MTVLDKLLPKKVPPIAQPPNSLEELSNLLTEKLKEYDCFDFDVPMNRLNAMKKIIKGRDLEWVNMEGADETFEFNGVATIVIGKPGADFERHEQLR